MRHVVTSVVLAFAVNGARAQGGSPTDIGPPVMKNTGTPGKAEAIRTEKVTGVVTEIDAAKQTLTLRNPAGEVQTFAVGPLIRRLSDVTVGDAVLVEYQQDLTLELQPASAPSVPRTAFALGEPAAGGRPARVASSGVAETVTVAAIDKADRGVMLLGPTGETYRVKAGPSINLAKLKVGDRLLATYVQAVAVALEKQAR